MVWPALSPDLNPIEHFWDQLQRKVNQLRPGPSTAAELRQALISAWCNIPRDVINRLIHSMRRRCQAVINVHGGHTPYWPSAEATFARGSKRLCHSQEQCARNIPP
ncbi:hypothetical protein V1264_013181 [Littorina saxatilis]|uniref:Tc1-like transposase DDE domain-containing protein n=1 Tax=Littorina saxatilis TaxID=31220 RepID=A0AAN9GIG0_9CAEN